MTGDRGGSSQAHSAPSPVQARDHRWKRRCRRAFFVSLLLALGFGVALLSRPVLERRVSEEIERQLESATGLPARLESFAFTWPPGVRVGKVVLGRAPAPAAEGRELRILVDVAASLRTRRVWLAGESSFLRLRPDLFPPATRPRSSGPPGEGGVRLPVAGVFRVAELELGSAEWGLVGQGVELRLEPLPDRRADEAVLRSSRLRFEREGKVASFEKLLLALEVGPKILARRVGLSGDIFRVAGESKDGARLEFEGALELGACARWLGIGERELRGEVSFGGTLRGDLRDPEAEVRLEGRSVAYRWVGADRAQAELEWKEGRLRVLSLGFESSAGRLELGGEIRPLPPYTFGARLEGRDWPLPEGYGTLVRGELEVRGTLSPLSVEGQGEARGTTKVGPLVSSASFRMAGAEGRGQLEARVGEWAELVLRGARGSEGWSGLLEAEVSDLSPLGSLGFEDVEGGRLRIEGTLGGSGKLPRIEGSLAAENLAIRGSVFGKIRAVFAANDERARIPEFSVTGFGGTGGGQVGWDFRSGDGEFELFWKGAKVAEIAPFLRRFDVPVPFRGGVLRLRTRGVRSGGRWRSAEAELVVEDCVLEKETLLCAAEGRFAEGGWSVRIDAEGREGGAFLRAEGEGSVVERGEFRVRKLPLERWLPAPLSARLGGRCDAEASFEGPFGRPRGAGSARIEGFRLGSHEFGVAELGWSSDGHSMEVRFETGDRTASTKAVLDFPRGRFGVDGEFRGFDLAWFLPAGEGTELSWDGSIRLGGNLATWSESVAGRVVLERVRVAVGARTLGNVSPVSIELEGGRAEARGFVLSGELGRVEVTGFASLRGEVDASALLDLDASVLELVGDPIVAGTGRIVGSIRVRHDGSWDLRGEGTLEDFSLDLGLPFSPTETKGKVFFEGQRLLLTEVAGNLGGGRYELEGTIDFAAGPDLRFRVRHSTLGIFDWLEEQVSADARLAGSWEKLRLSGDVTVESAVYDKNVALIELAPWFRKRIETARSTEEGKPVELDLRISAPEGVFVDTNVAKAELRADLRVSGTTSEPRVTGEVEVLEGEVVFGRRVFSLAEGTIRFRGRKTLDPLLSFLATTEVATPDEDYTIVAQVSGSLRSYRVTLSSPDAGLSQTDALSLLVLGRTAAQLQQAGGPLPVGDLVALAPVVYGGGGGLGLERYFPVDRLEIQPSYSPATGAFSPVLVVGKNLSERMRALVSTTLGGEARNSVTVEYEITAEILAAGTWQNQTETTEGAFGADLKFRHFFRHLPRLCPWSGSEAGETVR